MVFNKLRHFLSHSRLPIRIATMNPKPRVYRVRIRNAERSSYMWPILGGLSLFVTTKIALGDGDKTLFIPLSLPYEVPLPPYAKDDPMVQMYTAFHYNYDKQVEVKNRVADLTVKAFEKEKAKFGNHMSCSIMWLWFQFPSGPPPENRQSGLEISRNSVKWTTRTMHPYNYHRLKNIIWPQWMYNSLAISFHRIVATIKKEIQELEEEEAAAAAAAAAGGNETGAGIQEGIAIQSQQPQSNPTPLIAIPHPEFTAKVAFDETVGPFRQTLRKTRRPPPPPKGHVRVSGIVQITGEKILVHVDVDATFNPETGEQFQFNAMKVRYVAFVPKGMMNRQRNPRPPKIPPPLQQQKPAVAMERDRARGLSSLPPPPPGPMVRARPRRPTPPPQQEQTHQHHRDEAVEEKRQRQQEEAPKTERLLANAQTVIPPVRPVGTDGQEEGHREVGHAGERGREDGGHSQKAQEETATSTSQASTSIHEVGSIQALQDESKPEPSTKADADGDMEEKHGHEERINRKNKIPLHREAVASPPSSSSTPESTQQQSPPSPPPSQESSSSPPSPPPPPSSS